LAMTKVRSLYPLLHSFVCFRCMPLDQRPTGASQSFNHPFCLYFPFSFGAPHSSINICPQLGFFSGSFPSFPFLLFPYFPFPRPIPHHPLVANSFFLLSQQSTAPPKDHSPANSLFYFGQIILHFRLSHPPLPFDNYSPFRHISSSQFFQPPNFPLPSQFTFPLRNGASAVSCQFGVANSYTQILYFKSGGWLDDQESSIV
jgi:hypothetical protein